MRPPRPPRDANGPRRPKAPARSRPTAGSRAPEKGTKSPSAASRDARRAAQHSSERGAAPAPRANRDAKPRPDRAQRPARPPRGRPRPAPEALPVDDRRAPASRRGAARHQPVAARPRKAEPSAIVAPGEGQRIAKLLARAGIASRREIERMIEERRVAVDGVPIETAATILRSLHGVTVDGAPVEAPEATRLFRYHKPTGLLTAERDPKGRPTIYDRFPPGLPRVMPVGRLDLNTEGLLLLTTDGEFKRLLELPLTGVERSYRARVFGPVSQAQLEDLIEGIEIEGVRYGSIDANLERRTGRNGWVQMRLKEGKNREVRRVLEHLGLQVSRLIRTSYGPFQLGDLPAGAVDEVRQHDLVAFQKLLKARS